MGELGELRQRFTAYSLRRRTRNKQVILAFEKFESCDQDVVVGVWYFWRIQGVVQPIMGFDLRSKLAYFLGYFVRNCHGLFAVQV